MFRMLHLHHKTYSKTSETLMNFTEYQLLAKGTAVYPKGYVYPILGLAGETGEVVEQFKRVFRDDNYRITDERREKIKKELGDVLWYVSATCTELELDLDDVAQSNITKLYQRKAENKLHGEGDNR